MSTTLLALLRAYLALQPRCSGTFRLRPHSDDNPPETPCSAALNNNGPGLGKYATHHEPWADVPSLCEACATWSQEQNDHAISPRRDLAEFLALVAAVTEPLPKPPCDQCKGLRLINDGRWPCPGCTPWAREWCGGW